VISGQRADIIDAPGARDGGNVQGRPKSDDRQGVERAQENGIPFDLSL
jgi:hypothetical protein